MQASNIPSTEFRIPFPLLRSYQKISPFPRHQFMFRNIIRFYGEELLAPRPAPKLDDHPLSAIRNCVFNIFSSTFYIGGFSFIRNLRRRHAVVTGPTYNGN